MDGGVQQSQEHIAACPRAPRKTLLQGRTLPSERVASGSGSGAQLDPNVSIGFGLN